MTKEHDKQTVTNMPYRFLKKPSVIKLSGLSSTTIHRWMKEGKFPKSIRLTEKTTVWSQNELVEWMEQMKQGCRS